MSFSIPLNFDSVHDSVLSHQELIHWVSSKENKVSLSPVSHPFLQVCMHWGVCVLKGSPALRALAWTVGAPDSLALPETNCVNFYHVSLLYFGLDSIKITSEILWWGETPLDAAVLGCLVGLSQKCQKQWEAQCEDGCPFKFFYPVLLGLLHRKYLYFLAL